MMYGLESESERWSALGQRFECVYAKKTEDKKRAYALRRSRKGGPGLTWEIDDQDRLSEHFLLFDRASGRDFMSARLSTESLQKVLESPQLMHGERGEIARVYLPFESNAKLYVLSRVSLNAGIMAAGLKNFDSADLGVFINLCAFTMARLLFADALLLELNLQQFKRCRAKGLQLEYAAPLMGDAQQRALFYIDLNQDLKKSSVLQPAYQALQNSLVSQLNRPMIQENVN